MPARTHARDELRRHLLLHAGGDDTRDTHGERGEGEGGGVVYKHLHKHEGKDTQNTTTTDKRTWGRGRFGESSGTRRRTRVSLGGEVV